MQMFYIIVDVLAFARTVAADMRTKQLQHRLSRLILDHEPRRAAFVKLLDVSQ